MANIPALEAREALIHARAQAIADGRDPGTDLLRAAGASDEAIGRAEAKRWHAQQTARFMAR